mgnify:FL=1
MKIAVGSGLGTVWSTYDPRCLDEDLGHTVAGGEGAMLRTSFALAERGHDVEVFAPTKGPTSYRGVRFRPLLDAHLAILTEPFDALCSWSDAAAIRCAPPTVRRIFVQQLNDMPQDLVFWRNVDVIVPASATHGRFLAQWQPKDSVVGWVPLYGGVLPALWADALAWPLRKPVVSWWSSPDRGLHHLLAMWPRIRSEVPSAELRIAYHVERFIRDARELLSYGETPWRARILNSLLQAAKRAGGVQVLGAIPRKQLARHQGETKVWAFPFDSICSTEGLSVAMAEAIACGSWPIARPDDALLEVYGPYAQWIPAGVCDDAWRTRFADAVIHALKADVNPYEAKAADFVRGFTWEQSARNLERACSMQLKRPDVLEGIYAGM